MKTPAKSKRFRRIAPVGVLVITLCAIAVRSGAVEPTTQPSTRTSTTTKPYTPDNISEAAIELTYRQKTALSAVRDGQHWDEPAFFMMLARTAELVDPKTAAREYPSLESPAIASLTTYPNRYRAQKIRLTVRVHLSREFVSGSKAWEACADWPKGKKLWSMTGYYVSKDYVTVDGKKKRAAEEIVIYSLVDPTELLGKPQGTNASGEQLYGSKGRFLELAGVYYKTFKQNIRSKQARHQIRDYPLVIAYYLKATKNIEAETSPIGSIGNVIIIAMVLLVGLLLMVRRQAKRARSTPIGAGLAGNLQYTPLRNIEDDDLPPEQQDTEPVDPDLVDALKAFENKRKKNDAADDKS
jgi:hypothetical protein